jgi:hypothetical protein
MSRFALHLTQYALVAMNPLSPYSGTSPGFDDSGETELTGIATIKRRS